LSDVMLEMSDLLFDVLNSIVHFSAYEAFVATGFARRIFSSSGWITFA
jgi:hypothetical protein